MTSAGERYPITAYFNWQVLLPVLRAFSVSLKICRPATPLVEKCPSRVVLELVEHWADSHRCIMALHLVAVHARQRHCDRCYSTTRTANGRFV